MELVPGCIVIKAVSPQMLYILLLCCVVIHSVCSTLPQLLTVLTSVMKQMFSDTDEVKICRTEFGIQLYACNRTTGSVSLLVNDHQLSN